MVFFFTITQIIKISKSYKIYFNNLCYGQKITQQPIHLESHISQSKARTQPERQISHERLENSLQKDPFPNATPIKNRKSNRNCKKIPRIGKFCIDYTKWLENDLSSAYPTKNSNNLNLAIDHR